MISCWMVVRWADPIPGSRKTSTFTPCCHLVVALETAWRSNSDAPTSDSDTATVRMAAMVIRRLRHRLEAVSRAT